MFKKGTGDWARFRSLPALEEVDLHYGRRDPSVMSYEDGMYEVGAPPLCFAQSTAQSYIDAIL